MFSNDCNRLNKQQVLHADPWATQWINATENLEGAGNTRIFFILEEAKESVLDFFQGTAKVL